jgi:hypothetical protein
MERLRDIPMSVWVYFSRICVYSGSSKKS